MPHCTTDITHRIHIYPSLKSQGQPITSESKDIVEIEYRLKLTVQAPHDQEEKIMETTHSLRKTLWEYGDNLLDNIKNYALCDSAFDVDLELQTFQKFLQSARTYMERELRLGEPAFTVILHELGDTTRGANEHLFREITWWPITIRDPPRNLSITERGALLDKRAQWATAILSGSNPGNGSVDGNTDDDEFEYEDEDEEDDMRW